MELRLEHHSAEYSAHSVAVPAGYPAGAVHQRTEIAEVQEDRSDGFLSASLRIGCRCLRYADTVLILTANFRRRGQLR